MNWHTAGTATAIEKPYMRSILDHGVWRAYFEFESKWRQNHVEKIRIVGRLYFSQFHGPNSAITDAEQLKEIQSNGLQATLDPAVEPSARVCLSSRRDNTAAINFLTKPGADVNASFGEERTLLMLATELCSCNSPGLLALGVCVDDHDERGKAASELARQRHNERAIRLLQHPPEP